MDLNQLHKDIQEIKQWIGSSLKRAFQSDQINEVATALAKAQGEMEAAATNNTNPFFKSKYASFADTVRASRPSLSKYGISVAQRILVDEKSSLILETIMMHSSGQWLSSIMPINPPKDDAQARGSYITYMKRYSYAALVGVYTDDEDDDGSASVQAQQKQTKTLPKNYEKVTSEQVQNIMFEIGEYTDIAELLLKNFGIQRLSELPKEYYLKIIQKIRENVSSRKK